MNIKLLMGLVIAGDTLAQQKSAYSVAGALEAQGLTAKVAPNIFGDATANTRAYIQSEVTRNAPADQLSGYVAIGMPSPRPVEALFPNSDITTVQVPTVRTMMPNELDGWTESQKAGVIKNDDGTVSVSMAHYIKVVQQLRQEQQVKETLAEHLKKDPGNITIRGKNATETFNGRTPALVMHGHAYFDNGKDVTKVTAKELGIKDVNELTAGHKFQAPSPSSGRKR